MSSHIRSRRYASPPGLNASRPGRPVRHLQATTPHTLPTDALSLSTLAVVSLALLGNPLGALAQGTESVGSGRQETPTQPSPGFSGTTRQLPAVRVEAEGEARYRAEGSGSPKLTQPLVDTPRTVQVIRRELLQEQGTSTLMEALRNTPGITMQMGENGNTSSGDAFQMRGFTAQGSVFVDGIRDVGGISRDTFNLEQVEVVKGASGTDIGRGASAGYINLITKQAGRAPVSEAALTLGTAARKRLTGDLNLPIGEGAAVRLNVMAQKGGVDGRDVVRNEGYGLAPSITIGLGTPTRLSLSGQILRQNNVPDGGIPSIGLDGFYQAPASTGARVISATQAAAVTAGAPVRTANYYGALTDRERVDADQFTAQIEHDLGGGSTLRNIARYGRVHMDRILTGPAPGFAGSNVGNPVADPATWTNGVLRQRVDQVNEIIANQTSISSRQEGLGLRHDLVAGIEVMMERQVTRGSATAAQNVRGVEYGAIVNPPASLYYPDAGVYRDDPYLTGIDTDGQTVTTAAYVSDTVAVRDDLQFSGGLRMERYRTTTSGGTLVTAANLASNPGFAVGGVNPYNLENAGNLASWNLGAVWKPAPGGSVYVGMANAKNPPGSANFALSNSATNANSATLSPQRTRHMELGSKWELLDRRLLLSAAIFRTVNDGQLTQDPIDGSYVQNGKTRVQGLEINAVGQLTPSWQVSAGLAKMSTRQLEQLAVEDGSVTSTTGVRWSPDLAATFWSAWSAGGFTVGGGARYVSSQKRVITDSPSTANMPTVPSFWVADVMAAYAISKEVSVQLNVGNLFNRTYIAELNNSGARVRLGQPRAATLTARVRF